MQPLVIAKRVLYATGQLVVPEIVPEDGEPGDFFAVRSMADIPWPGTRLNRGEPVMTLLASGANLAECEARLRHLERTWMRRLNLVS